LSVKESNGAGIAVSGAAGDEVAPGARMPGLLDRLPLDRELSLEGPRFDGLSQGELLYELFSVAARHG
jgi:hypothetical protein